MAKFCDVAKCNSWEYIGVGIFNIYRKFKLHFSIFQGYLIQEFP